MVTQDLMLDAAEELFGERGISATSVQEVAERADRSIGSLYHHFSTKEVLVHAVVDRLLEGLQTQTDLFFAPDRWAGRPAIHVIRGYLRGVLNLRDGRPGYARIGRELSLMDDETLARYRAVRERTNTGLRELLLARRDEYGHPDPDTSVRVVVDMCIAMASARINDVTTPTSLQDLHDEAFVTEVTAACSTILQVEE